MCVFLKLRQGKLGKDAARELPSCEKKAAAFCRVQHVLIGWSRLGSSSSHNNTARRQEEHTWTLCSKRRMEKTTSPQHVPAQRLLNPTASAEPAKTVQQTGMKGASATNGKQRTSLQRKHPKQTDTTQKNFCSLNYQLKR